MATKAKAKDAVEQKFHFYASSLYEWKTDADLRKLMKDMDRDEYDYNLFYIPLPASAPYEIRMYEPEVKGAVYLGQYCKKQKK
jgi:hypothetical protein